MARLPSSTVKNLNHDLQWLNSLSPDEATNELLKCCGSIHWARQMSNARPYSDRMAVLAEANRIWWSLTPEDWFEAFRSHPKIGDRKVDAKREGETSLAHQWAVQEQSGVRDAALETLESLAKLNGRYEDKFGYIFIVCATGKSSEEMLANVRARIENDEAEELPIAAAEQAKITELRLNKLLTN